MLEREDGADARNAIERGAGEHAVVVGSGPNGLVAAVTLARAGWRVTLYEAAPRIGGGLRTEALTGDGFLHDVCATVHPLALVSPALRGLPLSDYGVRWAMPDVALAHPLDGGRTAVLQGTVEDTAAGLGEDGDAYRSLLGSPFAHGRDIVDGVLDPLRVPRAPLALARFGFTALRSALGLANARFEDLEARALLGGVAAHAMLPLEDAGTAGYGLFLTMIAHLVGWPLVEGGSQRLADALASILRAHGGTIVTDHEVTSLAELPRARAVLLDLTPRQVLRVAGSELPARYARALSRFRYGHGVFKLDWALAGPVPWVAEDARRAATLHLGGTLEEIAASEAAVAAGHHPEHPFVIFVQPTVVDPSRAPAGRHVAWAYCHVPNGSTVDCTELIENQIERFAPGFRDLVIERRAMDTAAMQRHDANYIGGDINGGAGDLRQLFTRPVVSARPWVTPRDGLYLCSASTPPGGGVHGMCGFLAARAAMRRADRVCFS